MDSLSIGKTRNLQTCSTNEGIFTILAVDHRDALSALLNPNKPEEVEPQELVNFKFAIASTLGPAASAVLLDPIYSAPQVISSAKVLHGTGLLVALEEQGYLGDPFQRRTTLINGWSVEKAKRMGANGVKMLLFYHPRANEVTNHQELLVRSIVADCNRYEIPLFLEPISYSITSDIKKGTADFALLKTQLVIETARRLSEAGADILKVEFPVDVKFEQDRDVWIEACHQLNDVCQSPWVLLSAGEPYDTFKEQLSIACEAGCSGFAVGRAVWQEAVNLEGMKREQFLTNIALPRLRELGEIAKKFGSPWFSRKYPCSVNDTWYYTY